MEPITIANAPQKFRSCFETADNSYGNKNGRLDSDQEANEAAERCCKTNYDDCRPLRDELKAKGFNLAEPAWVRIPLDISRAPDKFKPYLRAGDLARIPPEGGDGRINSDHEMVKASDACLADNNCDLKEMGRYLLNIVDPPVEERALRILITPAISLGYGHYYSGVPGGSETAAYVPARPDDIQNGRADSWVQTAGAKSGFVAEPRLELVIDLWQHLFVKYKLGISTLSCAGPQDGYDNSVYPTACFRRTYSNSFTVGFYPYFNSIFGPEHNARLLKTGKDYSPRVERKNYGLFLGIEAGLAVSKFNYELGWHQWDSYYLDDNLKRSAYRYGINLGTSAQLLQKYFMGIEWGLESNIFPGAYFDISLKFGAPLQIFNGLKQTRPTGK
jgi:hypothetical protein